MEDGRFVLNMLAGDSSEMLVSLYQTTRQHIPEDCFFKERKRQDREQEENKAGSVGIHVTLRRVSVTIIAIDRTTCSECECVCCVKP